MMRRGRLVMGLIMALVAFASYYGYREVNPITGEKQHIGMSQEQEVAMGLQAAPQMADQFGGLHPDSNIQSKVQEIGTRLVRQSVAGSSAYKFSFNVLKDAETVNAFALPGGPIFITAALLNKLENEAQLAGVLGHEVGHVLARHSAEHMAKSQLAQLLVGAVGVAATDEERPGRGQQAAAAAGLVSQMVNLRYGRHDELESDGLGVRLMSEAGYDPRSMLEVMRILAASSKGGRQPEFLNTHPDPGNREENIKAAIAERYPQGVPGQLTTGRSLKEIL
ncbi:MAG: M48 family metalloprotease, partial [Terriglobia bacterium]